MIRRGDRPSHATAVAYAALFVALGGSSYAAVAISGKDIRDGTVTTKDVKNSSLLLRDFKRGQIPVGPQGEQGPTGPQGPQGPQGETGSTGRPGEPGSALAYAHVNSDGTFDPASSKNLRHSATVSRLGVTAYCLDFSVDPKNAVASLSGSGFGAPGEIAAWRATCSGSGFQGNVVVRTWDSAGNQALKEFEIVVN